MPLPSTWTLVTITGTFTKHNGAPAQGYVTFESTQPVVIGGTIIVPDTIRANLDGNGQISVQLPATNDPDLSVTGWTYTVNERMDNGRSPYQIEVPYTVTTLDLATIPTATPNPSVPSESVLHLSDVGVIVAAQSSITALAAPGGSDLVGFLQAGAGATTRTAQGKFRDIVHAKDFGVVANGVTNDTSAMQSAINYAASIEATLVLPPGDIWLTSAGLTHSTGSLHMVGTMAGTQGTRLCIKVDSPALTLTAQATIENVGFIGELNGAKTNQVGVYINNTNNITLKECVFDSCYDSVHIKDESHYCRFDKLRMFDVVNRHLRGSGTAAAGYQFDFTNSVISATTCTTDLYFENAGSITMNNVIITPANATERCFHLVSNATNSGVHQVSNCVFEGSTKEALRIEGTSGAPIKHMQFSNCYFNQDGAGLDGITILYGQYLQFTNCYISGIGSGATGAAVTFANDVKYLSFVNCDLPGSYGAAVFRGLTGATLDTVDIINPAYTGSVQFLDLSAVASASITRVAVRGGRIGTNATPINIPTQGLVSTDHWMTWSAGAPVPGAGSFTTASVSTSRYRRNGNTVQVMFEVTITTNGTAATSITVNLPIAAAQPAQLNGRERNALGHAVTGTILSAGTTVLLKKYDDAYPGADNTIISMSGSYEVA